MALPYLFEFWAHAHQLPPEGAWKTWVILGGRGAGKTRAGAEWIRAMAEGDTPLAAGRLRRMALMSETFDQTRDVMVLGESGILASTPKDRRPVYHAGKRLLEWPNGAQAQLFSAYDPEGLRGPQFDGAWADELGKWKKADAAWDMLQFALRLGDHPQQLVTTTPRKNAALKRLLAAPTTVQTHAPTEANRAYLAESFLSEVRARFGNSRLGRQELDGVFLEDVEGALWTNAMIEGLREEAPRDLGRIVVAVDPPAGDSARSDACGIIVAGMRDETTLTRAWVLADRSVQGKTPLEWARVVAKAVADYGADRVVVETNQGGAMVETVLRQVDPNLPITRVHATKGKTARAEPVAALYEQGRVKHAGALATLEDQMCQMTVHGFEGSGSPDRVDALVWAIHALLLSGQGRPMVRSL